MIPVGCRSLTGSTMWTPATRRQHSREGLRYETDLTDAEWALIEPHMPKPRIRGRPREWPLREVLNAIFYVLRGGVAWRLLPNDLPPSESPPIRSASPFTPADGWSRGSSPGSAETGGSGKTRKQPSPRPRLPLRRLSHAPHTPIGPPVRWVIWGPGLRVAAPFGMLERGPC